MAGTFHSCKLPKYGCGQRQSVPPIARLRHLCLRAPLLLVTPDTIRISAVGFRVSTAWPSPTTHASSFIRQAERYSRRTKALASLRSKVWLAVSHLRVVWGKREATPPSNTASVSRPAKAKGAVVRPCPRQAPTNSPQWLIEGMSAGFRSLNFLSG